MGSGRIVTPGDQAVSPALQLGSPELVTAIEIDQWSGRLDAKETFPELMRRLLEQTSGITNLEVRAHEGVAAPGWDATADSAGSTYLPAGKLCFEFGTSKSVKAKADNDYQKRIDAPPGELSSRVFVFATPRNWSNAQKWAEKRRAERKFADVKVIDAHTLEGWLQATPPVHYWLSERLGRKLHAQTLQAWWECFQPHMKIGDERAIDVPPCFFRAGRDEQAQKLVAELKSEHSEESLSVSSVAANDVLAFVYASLVEERALLERAFVVDSADAWARLTEDNTPTLLIPQFANPDVTRALKRGHRVLEAIDATAYSRGDATVALNKVGRAEASAILRDAGFDIHQAERMAALARRSMTAFFRFGSPNKKQDKPTWFYNTETLTLLQPLVLVGAWQDDDTGDKELIEELVGESMKYIRSRLELLNEESDPLFVYSASVWRLADPVGAARLLLHDDGIEPDPETVNRWKSLVPKVLLAGDPYTGMKAGERLVAQVNGLRPSCSDVLREHVAEGLVLAAVSSSALELQVKGLVRQLLSAAFDDPTGGILVDVAPAIPLLAEAAPDEFLAAVSNDIDSENPVVSALFREDIADESLFGSSSRHHHLQSALERLCWSNEYFGSAGMILAGLASFDRSGAHGGGPLESLYKVTAGWCVQSDASVDDKIEVVRAVLDRYPEVGWRLGQELLRPERSILVSASGPLYRDWELPQADVSYGEFSQYTQNVLGLVVKAADSEADRWCELVSLTHHLSGEGRTELVQAILNAVQSAACSWNDNERYSVWCALKAEISAYEAHRSASWAASGSVLETLRQAAELLNNPDDPRQYAHLFGWSIDLKVNGLRWDDEGYDAALEAEQQKAVDRLVSQGGDAVRILAVHAERPEVVGTLLARTGSLNAVEVVSWLREKGQAELRRAVCAYVSDAARERGVEWVKDVFEKFSQDSDIQVILMEAIPMEMRFWSWVGTLDGKLVSDYWHRADCRTIPVGEREAAVEVLIGYGAAWRALEVVELLLYDKNKLDVTTVKKVLAACLTTSDAHSAQHHSWAVSRLLKWIESTAPDDSDLPLLEFYFFDFVGGHDPSNALYGALGAHPEEFVAVVKAAYGKNSEEVGEPSRSVACQRLAWSVLWNWSALPGLRADGSIDATHLRGWVRECRKRFEDYGLGALGDHALGEVLATSPDGDDGKWPTEVVRGIVEDLKSLDLEAGLVTGRCNQGGASVRGAYDGGRWERRSAARYRQAVKHLQLQWPRTANVLRQIAYDYEVTGRHLDELDERRADEG
ncbi:hypothetical protein [Actinomyces sp. Z5]|uniref:hypothetical protein n=1 Tax=Actinomyces sp. Z5 TaxID=2250216 RepID=UPI0011BEABA3|nr:hypothetical protein [Actinomyces sp. Z5]